MDTVGSQKVYVQKIDRLHHYAVVHLAIDFYAENYAKLGSKIFHNMINTFKLTVSRDKNLEKWIVRDFPEGMDFLVQYKQRKQLDQQVCHWNDNFHLIKEKLELPGDLSFSIGIYEIGNDYDRALMPQYQMKATFARYFGHFYFNPFARYFNDTDYRMLQGKKRLETQLPNALREHQLLVYLQPQYDLTNGKIKAAEALVRWKHPKLGMLMPDVFIPIFEQDRFILSLDFYMLEEVCRLLCKWHTAKMPICPISINFSKQHAETDDFLPRFSKIIDQYHIQPGEIYIEWTENVFTEPDIPVSLIADTLRSKGFRVAMDDFGSGYSSLNTLTDLPVDIIKLDKQFLKFSHEDARRRFLLQQIIRITQSLHYTVLAEGVEYEWQADMLRRLGCKYAQGYLYSRPVPIDTYERMLCQQAAIFNTKGPISDAAF